MKSLLSITPALAVLFSRMPLFRIEKPENASLWMRREKGIYQLIIPLF
jgi:hypothetical protein